MKSTMAGIACLAAALSHGQSARKILEAPLVFAGEISPSGRFVPFVEKNNLWLVDSAAGKRTRLTDFPEGHGAANSTISPDDQYVAFRHTARSLSCEVRLVRTNGGPSKVLFASEAYRECWPVTWTPDRTSVLIATVSPGESLRRLILVQAKNGSSRDVPMKTGVRLTGAAFSADGRWLAFTDSAPNQRAGRITLLSAATGEMRLLTTTSATERLAGWRKDGRVYFTSDAMGDPALFAVDVVDGQSRGEPVLILKGVGKQPLLGMSRTGVLYRLEFVDQSAIYLAGFNSASLTIESPPRELTGSLQRSSARPSFSRDGKRLAFVSAGFDSPELRIVIYDVATAEIRTISQPIQYALGLSWYPDDSALIACGAINPTERSCFRVGVTSNESSLLRTGLISNDAATNPTISPDGHWLYYKTHRSGARTEIIRHDLHTNEESEVIGDMAGRNVRGYSLSPDGSRMALNVRDANNLDLIDILDLANGELKTVYSYPAESFSRAWVGLWWSPSGEQLLFQSVNRKDPNRNVDDLLVVSASGGPATKLTSIGQIQYASSQPNGNYVAWETHSAHNELWVIQLRP